MESGPVGIRAALVNAHVLDDLVDRDHRAFALRIGLRQPLPQMQQHDGIEEGELRAPEEHRRLQVARIGLPGKCDLRIGVDDQIQE